MPQKIKILHRKHKYSDTQTCFTANFQQVDVGQPQIQPTETNTNTIANTSTTKTNYNGIKKQYKLIQGIHFVLSRAAQPVLMHQHCVNIP